MKRIDTSSVVDPSRKQPFTVKSLDFLQDSKEEDVVALVKSIAIVVYGTYDATFAYIIDGCVTDSVANITAGTILFNGKVYDVSALSSAVNGLKLDITKTNDAIDPIIFSDGFSDSVHDIFSVTVTDDAAIGDINVLNLKSLGVLISDISDLKDKTASIEGDATTVTLKNNVSIIKETYSRFEVTSVTVHGRWLSDLAGSTSGSPVELASATHDRVFYGFHVTSGEQGGTFELETYIGSGVYFIVTRYNSFGGCSMIIPKGIRFRIQQTVTSGTGTHVYTIQKLGL